MKNKKLFLVVLLILIFTSLHGFAQQDYIDPLKKHLMTVPIIESLGIFSSVSAMVYSDNTLTWTASITSLSFIAIQDTLGIISAFNINKWQNKIGKVHRVLGYTNIAVALFFNIVTSLDEQLDDKPSRFSGYGYTLFATIPIFTWRF